MRTQNNPIIGYILVIVPLANVACANPSKSGERVVMTCPPSMAPAASQRVCIAGACGNRVLDAEEECDDGNIIDGDGCSSDCQSAEVCGNAIVDHAVGELCDDGNTSSGDECCSDCRSCPELAVRRGAVGLVVDVEPLTPIEIEEAPCPSMLEVGNPPGWLHSPPEPLLVRLPASTPLLDALLLDAASDVLSPGEMSVLEEARVKAENAQQRIKSEVRARRRLLQAQEVLNEELLRAHDLIAELEHINGELHQHIADECQVLPSGRGKALH